MVHRVLNKMQRLWDESRRVPSLEQTIQELRDKEQTATQQKLDLEHENEVLKKQIEGSRDLGRRLSAVARIEANNMELQRKVLVCHTCA